MPNQRRRGSASHGSFDNAQQMPLVTQTPLRNRRGSPPEPVSSGSGSRKRTRSASQEETPSRPTKARRTGYHSSPTLPALEENEGQEDDGSATPRTLVNDTGYQWDTLPQSKDRSIATERQREQFRHPGSTATTSEETSRWAKVMDRLRQLGHTRPQQSGQQFVHDKIENDEVRLLVLEPLDTVDPKVAPITVRLRTVKLQALKSIEFEALSYHWGQEMSKRPILIVHEPPQDLNDSFSATSGERFRKLVSTCSPFNVTANLYNALHRLRKHKPTTLWIDAICIQQNRPEEKQIQIGYMGEIYSSARRVRIWLGNSDDRTNSAMKFIDTVVNLKDEQEYLKDDFIEKWADLQHLIRSEWFSRRWTIQEVGLAKTAVVSCGLESQNWKDFRVAISVFVRHFDRIKANFRKKGYDHDAIGEIDGFGAKVLVEVEANMFRRDADGSVFEPAYSLEMLVSSLTSWSLSAGSSKPRKV